MSLRVCSLSWSWQPSLALDTFGGRIRRWSPCAEQLIAAERYEEASTLLEPLAKQSYFVRRHAGYLLALGLARQFASASKAENAGDDLLDDARKQFGELFAASPSCG